MPGRNAARGGRHADSCSHLTIQAWLAKANRVSLKVEGAFPHIVTDLYGFLGTVAAGVVLLLTGYARADSIASLIVVR